MFSSQDGYTYIVVLYQDEQGACDRLQWGAQIGGFLDTFDGHPDSSECRFLDRIRSLDGSTNTGRVTSIVERGSDREGNGGR